MEISSLLMETWGIYPQLSADLFQQGKEAGIEALHMQILANRGLKTVDEMLAFLQVDYHLTRDPLTLIDMSRALGRIQEALSKQEHITVYGDYDADGVTSSALLFRALQRLKHPDAILDYHIPHRLHDGCGLNMSALDMLKQRGTRLIITTDCASSDVEQVAYANASGIDVIITDHHHTPAVLPQAYAMVNPWRADCHYGERYLCGVGIAFKLTQALFRAYHRPIAEELELLDLVAIGTIADIAPLLGENHTLVRLGLEQLNVTQKPGLRALIRAANLQPGKIRERDIAFGISPRINAAGRMKEAAIAFELLVTDDEEEAARRVVELDQLNIERQRQTEELLVNVKMQAVQQSEKGVIVAVGDDWHEGIIGLIAGKVSEEVQKPVLVISNNPATGMSRGSARSQKGFNIIAALRGFADKFERYGGHAQAAGFTMRHEDIGLLHDYLLAWQESGGLSEAAIIEGTYLPDPTGIVTEQESSEATTTLTLNMVDLIFTRSELLNYQTYKLLRQLRPFGAGNPEPVFMMQHLQLINTWTSGPNRQNLRLRLGGPNNRLPPPVGTYTRGASEQARLANVSHVDIIFRLESVEDDLRPEVWIKILEVQPSVPQNAEASPEIQPGAD
ncbi:MAG TPA: single-stranded-DNA-specific exonuclease RecJ [Dictyobacter sp.]|nr:single-stranded-DNA-specific exonuclease RecJ [Dictyobacter sp.]